ncbi:MAG: substrate-binding domain-containing protein, partial [Muribaculaceae bacterium]|nr:substrate-binding domain-containing protein [Muribaculaceae bacterium]
LSVSEIGDILTGKITDWNQIEPSKIGEIKVVFDNNLSSTLQYMRDSLMDNRPFGPNVFAQDSIEGVFDAVSKLKGAVGVVGVTWLSTDMDSAEMPIEDNVRMLESDAPTQIKEFGPSIKVLKIRRDDDFHAYQPYQQYIYDGSYPLFRQIYMITVGANGGLNHGFFSFVTGKIGQKIILRTGICPAVISPQVVSLEQ